MTSYPNYNTAFQSHRRRDPRHSHLSNRNKGNNDDNKDLSSEKVLLDFSNPNSLDEYSNMVYSRQHTNDNNANVSPEFSSFSSKDYSYSGPMYELTTHPGFVYVPQALSPSFQIQLAYLALTQYCHAPYARTNLLGDFCKTTSTDSSSSSSSSSSPSHSNILWEQYKQGYKKAQPQQQRQQHDEEEEEEIKIDSLSSCYTQPVLLLEKLSWSTLGYHYNWTDRQYTETNKSNIPLILQALGYIFAATSTASSSSFTSSAIIINYYNSKSTMGGHQDNLEYDFTKPVVSISLGLSAIFLLGQQDSKDYGPVIPILVRPGDVLIMGGSSRLCFHGIAQIITSDMYSSSFSFPPSPSIQDTLHKRIQNVSNLLEMYRNMTSRNTYNEMFDIPSQEDIDFNTISKENIDAVYHYLSCHRININMRQVLPDGIHSINNL